MRICELVFTPAFGGAETLALELAPELRQRRHEVVVTALQPIEGSASNGFVEDVETIEPPAWARGRKLKRLTAARRLITRGHYDIIHAHSFFPNLYARAAASLPNGRVPIVATLHSASDDFSKHVPRALEKMLASQAAAIVAVSPTLRDQYVEYFPQCRDRTMLIPNGVRKFPLPSHEAVAKPREFAVIGRIAQQKDLKTLIRGFGSFVSEVGNSDLSLHVIGPETDSAYAGELRHVADAVAPSKVIFHGAVRDPFGRKRIDVVIHAAPKEGHPITILEAAARGIPIVCTRAPTVSGTIDDRCTTFSAGDEQGLCRALLDVYFNWPAAIDLAADAWLTVPDITDCATAYETLFLDLVRSNGQAG